MPATVSFQADFSGQELYGFSPDLQRVRFLDQRMRGHLRISLAHVFSQAGSFLDIPLQRLDQFLSRVEREPISPLAFSLYCDLVIAIEDEKLDEARALTIELIALPESANGLKIVELADPQKDSKARRYARFIDTDPEMPFQITAPTREMAADSRRKIAAAFALMDAGDPLLAQEIRALLREIVLAAGVTQAGGYTFDGASSFMLWGAIILNADRAREPLTMVRMLAHESAHNLLFGMTLDEPLLKNSPDERHKSPLRDDPRPLEGIYHATFVSARMHRAIKTILESGTLSSELAGKARLDLTTDANCFNEGYQVLREHGHLTEIGQAILQNVAEYMAAAS